MDVGWLEGPIAELADAEGVPVVVSVSVEGRPIVEIVRGAADRRHGVPNTIGTRFMLASAAKSFTGLMVMSLVADGTMSLDDRARRYLGDDLPLIDDAVTVEHLLAHRSGIGDYLDESVHDDKNAYVMPVPVQQLDSTEAYLAVLDGHPQVSAPGERFEYNNGGFVLLALLAERAAGRPFERLVHERVIAPAGLTATAFERTDEPGPGVAVGYLELTGLRTNALHLPVLGSGDGGIVSTVGDVDLLWRAMFSGDIVPTELVDLVVEPRSTSDWGPRYGLGFWLAAAGSQVVMEGADAGISFRSIHDAESAMTATVVSNTTDGAWSIARYLRRELAP